MVGTSNLGSWNSHWVDGLEHEFYDFPNFWDDDPMWRTHFFKMVKTTNQNRWWIGLQTSSCSYFLLKPGSKNRWIYLFGIKVWWLCALKPSNMLLGSPRFLRHLYHTMASWLIVIGLWFPYSLTQVLAHQCLIGTGMYVCRWKVEENGPSAFFSLQNPWGKIDQKCL